MRFVKNVVQLDILEIVQIWVETYSCITDECVLLVLSDHDFLMDWSTDAGGKVN